MKKLACILLALALVGCGNKERNIENIQSSVTYLEEPRKTGWSRVCIDGYEYIVWRGAYDSRAITQRTINGKNGNLHAVECK